MTVYTTVPLDDSNLDVTVTESNDLVYIDINPAAFATIGVSKEYVDDRDAVTLSSANSYTDTSIAAIPPTDLTSYETIVNSEAGDATTLSSANTYTDTSIAAIPAVDLSSYETIVNSNAGDATTLSSANTYTDTSIAAIPAVDLSSYETIVNSNAGDATTLSSANTYTDTSIAAIPATDLSAYETIVNSNAGDATTLSSANTYTDTSLGAYSTTVQVEALPVSTFTNDAGYLTTETDSQTLSFANPNLTISNGNSVDLSSLTPTVPVTSVNTLTGDVVLTTTEVAEGTNEYFTDAKARTAVSLVTDSSDLTYSSATGVFTYLTPVGAPAPANRVQQDVRNTTGSTILSGSAVYISGASGNKTLIALADADATGQFPAVGVVVSDISNNADGIMVIVGEIQPYDTTNFADNDTLYLSTTAGVLTNTRPGGQGTAVQNIGRVVRGGVSNGIIAVLGSGRANDTPNLSNKNVFIGTATNGVEQRQLDYTTDLLNLPTIPTNNNELTNGAGYATTTEVTTGDSTTLSSANTYTDTSIAAIDLANLSDVVTIDPDSSGMTIGATGVTTAKWGSSAPLFWRSDSDDGALKNFVFDNTSQNIFVGMHWKTADSNKKLFRFDATASGGTDPGDGSHTTNFVLSGTNNIFKSRLQNETKTGLEFDANNINLTTTDGVTINSNYTLPNVDGNQDQQLTTDGNGNVSWGDTHSVIDDSGTAPNMTTRNGNTTAFQFISDDQDYNGAYSATLNMISWANLASNNVAFVSYKTTNNNQMLNLKASGSADDGSHQADFTLRGAEGYFSTRDNSSGSGALTDMTFEGTDLTFQASGEIKFEAPRSNVKGLLTISDGVSDYTFPASDGNQDQVMTTNGSGQLAWVASGAVAVTSAPTLTGNADAYKNINYNLTVSNHDNYDNPTYVFGVYDSSGNQVLNNDDFTRISDDTFQFIPPNTSTGTVYDIKVKCQDFGSGQSVTTTKSVTLAVAQARYWRLMNFSGKSIQVGSYPAAVPEIDKGTHDAGTWIDLFALYSQPNQYSVATAGVVMTSNTLPIDKVTSDNYHYSDWEAWKAFDNNNSSNHWGNYGTTALASDYLQIDLGNSWNSSAYAGFSFRIRTKNYANEKVDIAMSSTGAFTGEETIITTVFLKPNYDNNIG